MCSETNMNTRLAGVISAEKLPQAHKDMHLNFFYRTRTSLVFTSLESKDFLPVRQWAHPIFSDDHYNYE
jgi:hypothetical protein